MIRSFHSRLVTVLAVLTLLVSGITLPAEELDDRYLRILAAVDQAGELQRSGRTDEARTRYEAAQAALLAIKKSDPGWKANMVAFRLANIEAQLAKLSPATETSTPAKAASVTTVPAKPVASAATTGEPTGVNVQLLQAGGEPRRPVRLTPTAGDRQQSQMTLHIGMEMSMGDNAMPQMNMPGMRMPVEAVVDQVTADGDITYTTTIGEVEVTEDKDAMPGVADAMRAAMGGAKGTATKSVISNRGVIKTADAKLPAGASPQLRQSLDQMKDALSGISAPFPEAPIGVGAKWEVKQVLKSQGMAIQQTATYELLALDGNRAEIKLNISQHAANQKISSPAMPGMKVDLQKMEGSGTGKVTYELTRMLPVVGEVESKADMQMSMSLGGQAQAMSVKTTSRMRFESK
jgi:hypothetical protein